MGFLLETKALRELNITVLRRFRQSYAWSAADVETRLRSKIEAAEVLDGSSSGQLKLNVEVENWL